MASLLRRPTGLVLGHLMRVATTAIPAPSNLHAHVTVRGAAAPAGKKGKAAVAVKKKKFDVETNTQKLVDYVCGLNYKLEGEEVKIKPDSEYPDWLFKMSTVRPEPGSDQLEPGTMEYYLKLNEEHRLRNRVLGKLRKKMKKFKI